MNRFIIQKSGSAIPGGTALLYRVFYSLSNRVSSRERPSGRPEVPVPAGDGQYGTAWWLQKKDYDNGAQSDAVEAGGLRGAGGSGLCAHSRSGGVILICISKTEHSIKSFHVSLMFDGLILASKTPEVNTAYYPKKKEGKWG